MTVFKIKLTFFISQVYYEVGEKWQNVNRRPNHEHAFMKQNFWAILALPPWKNFSRAPIGGD